MRRRAESCNEAASRSSVWRCSALRTSRSCDCCRGALPRRAEDQSWLFLGVKALQHVRNPACVHDELRLLSNLKASLLFSPLGKPSTCSSSCTGRYSSPNLVWVSASVSDCAVAGASTPLSHSARSPELGMVAEMATKRKSWLAAVRIVWCGREPPASRLS